MSLKDNFNQAVKELLKRDGLVGSDLSKNSKEKSNIDRYLDTPSANSEPIKPTFDKQTVPPPVQRPQSPTGFTPPPQVTPRQVQQTPPPAAAPQQDYSQQYQQQLRQPVPPTTNNNNMGGGSNPYFETEETTVISRNTIVDGNIRSFANVTVEGSVKGDVQITKNANLSGKVVGDLECNNATMLGSSMQGNVTSKGQVKMDRDSLLLGDINAQYLDINGKVKGNVEISGKAEFKTDSIIFGNINASTITVLDGATIQGFVNTTFLQESASNIFPEAIAVSE
ncbi:MAG: polymer-forming cytoskeletal protein [Oscillospiraceae bacterium]|nr:polymer-forming cytoskeletal protein [Oscillospiraceae bacterium]MBR4093155.1 polymer-forming cytoskeletal protein [Oscillospiraceae bacterium]